MEIQILEEQSPDWPAYGTIPIRFPVRVVLDAYPQPGGGFGLTGRPVDPEWVKDYDALRGEGPEHWARRFDVSRWGVQLALAAGDRIGGAVVVVDTPGIDMLEGRSDLAVLWDLRVRPSWRGQGVGTRLLRAAEAWSRRRGKSELKVETQNINAPACALYSRMGFELRAVDPGAYPALPGEVRFLWYKQLAD